AGHVPVRRMGGPGLAAVRRRGRTLALPRHAGFRRPAVRAAGPDAPRCRPALDGTPPAGRRRRPAGAGLPGAVRPARRDRGPAQLALTVETEARGGETGGGRRSACPHMARRALFDAVAGPRTLQEGVLLSRDLFPGVQRFAWQQGPAVDNDWQGYAATLRAALSVGNSGVAVQTHRLGNADRPSGAMTPELYLRWLA